MISLYTGRPRSGKSYRVVYQMMREETQAAYFILHDIDDLKRDSFFIPAHVRTIKEVLDIYGVSFDQFLQETFMADFTKEVREKYGKNVLLILDEAYRSLRKFDEAKANLFAYHGHYGMDIWLICQGEKQLHEQYRALVGDRIHAKKGSIINKFIYSHRDGTAHYKTSWLPKSKVVFNAYKSFDVAEKPKKGSALVPLLGVASLACLMIFVYWISDPFGMSKKEAVAAVSSGTDVKQKAITGKKGDVGSGGSRGLSRSVQSVGESGEFSRWSFAGVLGNKALLQDRESRCVSDSSVVFPGSSVLQASRQGCKLLFQGEVYSLVRLPMKPFVEAERASPFGAASGAKSVAEKQ